MARPPLEPTAPEVLSQCEQLAELAFTQDEVAIVLDIEATDFKRRPDLAKAWQRGRLRAEAAVRANVLQQAKQGSTPAQKLYFSLVAQAQPMD